MALKSLPAQYTLLLLAGLLVYAPSLVLGLPLGHSYSLNIVWAEAFLEALSWNTPYPRWVPSLWDGAGAGDFFFYSPVIFFIASAFDAICGCGVEMSLTFTALLMRLVAGAATLGLLTSLGLRSGALAGAVFIVLSPYHILDWAQRQAIGELAGASLIPLFLWGLRDSLWRQGYLRLTLGTGLLALTHLPGLVIASTVAVLLTLTVWRPNGLRALIQTCAAGLLGMALSAIYWLPALVLLDTVSAEQLAKHHWSGNLINLNSEDWMGFLGRVWVPFLLLSMIGAVAFLLSRGRGSTAAKTMLLLIAFCWVMMTPVSLPLWNSTAIAVIQFPWRYVMVADIAFAIAAAILMTLAFEGSHGRAIRARRYLIGMVIIVSLPIAHHWMTERAPYQFDWILTKRAGAIEWLGKSEWPLSTDFRMIEQKGLPENLTAQKTPIRPVSGVDALELVDEASNKLAFRASCSTSCEVIIKRSYWAYWSLTSEGDEVASALTPTAGFPFIRAVLPAGQADYLLFLRTPSIVYAATALSLIAACVLMAGAIIVSRGNMRA